MGNRHETAKKTGFNLDTAIPYLVARTGSRMGNAFVKALKPYELSLNEWRVCAALAHTPHQRLSELVVRACVDMSALSRIVDRLIAQGYVSREKSEEDGRAIRLTLTGEGAALAAEIGALAQRYEEVALRSFSKSEVVVLRNLLNRLYDSSEPLT